MNVPDTYEQFSGSTLKQRQENRFFRRIIRGAGAVLAGLLITIALSVGSDFILHTTGVYPPWGVPMLDSQFVLAVLYRSVYGVLGSYISALLAVERPMLHALVLGVIGCVLAIAGTVATWNGGPEFARKWYPITLIIISIPCGWLGGRLRLLKYNN